MSAGDGEDLVKVVANIITGLRFGCEPTMEERIQSYLAATLGDEWGSCSVWEQLMISPGRLFTASMAYRDGIVTYIVLPDEFGGFDVSLAMRAV